MPSLIAVFLFQYSFFMSNRNVTLHTWLAGLRGPMLVLGLADPPLAHYGIIERPEGWPVRARLMVGTTDWRSLSVF
jgi:hypothetical protein